MALKVDAPEFTPGDSPPPAPTAPLDPAEAQIIEQLEKLLLGESEDPAEVAYAVLSAGFHAMETSGAMAKLEEGMDNMGNPTAREGALKGVNVLAEKVGKHGEPFLVPLLSSVLERFGDKNEAVRKTALATAQTLANSLSQYAAPIIIPAILKAIDWNNQWQIREGALNLLKSLATTAPQQIAAALPEIVPLASEALIDSREQVKKAAYSSMSSIFKLNGNRDIEPCVPTLLSCIARPAESGEAITKLSATTFVQAVESPALAIMVPLLIRGLRHGETAIKRKTAVIISNMSKLVNNPSDATVFLPRLLPVLKMLGEEVADPECRSVAAGAFDTLSRIEKEAEEAMKTEHKVKADAGALQKLLSEFIKTEAPSVDMSKVPSATLKYVSQLAANLVVGKNFIFEEWQECVASYLESYMPAEDALKATKAFHKKCQDDARPPDDIDNTDDGPGEELCNCEFSLAYGGKILLNNARLIIKRGRRYGLCGANGAGKSTLMKAIAAGKVEGFPPADVLRTVYVEHDIQAAQEHMSTADYVLNDKGLKDIGVTADEVRASLTSVGFSEEMQAMPIAGCSGGWKMKLALARAMLLKADILLLDEPTNHLDRANVNWLETYLTTASNNVTCMVVSHDSGFLDTVCTDIYHYETRRLKRYRGNLSEFVKQKPEAASYYELGAATLKFTFPEPGPLDGVTSDKKSILKMTKVGFTYPNATKKALSGISLHCRLSSRVAVLGVNGAGKSTLIKLLTGELRPDEGQVTKHPNLRVAYVAQHAFHHLEDNLDTTPNRYILRRYSGGEDKEEAEKVSRKMNEEEWAAVKNQIWMIDGQERRLDKIVGRRKKRRSYEYEVAWQGLSSISFNRWITREELVERGLEKLVNEVDGKKAAAQQVGEVVRPLTVASIEEFLKDFGLDPEFSTHSNIRGLSGGQKVKLVLASAMWSNPHMLIMDEPTNYLDRESLGALAQAIREWAGGVVIISHHAEFIGALCTETWTVADGKLTITKDKGDDKEEA